MTNPVSPFNLPSLSHGPGLVFFGGCVRFETMGQPYIHTNDAHYSLGLSSVSIESDGDVRITFDRPVPIITGFIEEDENFSSAGILAGFSGGQGLVDIRFSDAAGIRLLPSNPKLWAKNRNLWVGFWGASQ